MSSRGDILLKIRRLVEEGDLSKVILAEKIGYSRNHIHHIIEGEARLYIDFLDKLCEIYNVPINYFLDDEIKMDMIASEQRIKYGNDEFDKKLEETLDNFRDLMRMARK